MLPPGRLAARLLLTARLAAPPALVHLFPADVPEGEMLVAIIHRCAGTGGRGSVVPLMPAASSAGRDLLSLAGERRFI